jgi:hypothetical protein
MTTIDATALKRQFMRAMVIGLGVAAVTGGLAIFTRAGWMVGRIAGTAAVLVVAVAFCLTVIGKLENPKTTRSASIALWIIAFSTFAFLVPIWAPMLGLRKTEELWLSAIFIAVAGGVSALMIQALVEPWSRLAGAVGLLMTAVTFVTAMMAAWSNRHASQEQIGATAAWIGCMMPVICMCLVGAFTDRRYWRWVGVIAGLAAMILALRRTWVTPATGYYQEPSAIIQLVTVAALTAHTIIIDRVPLNPNRRWVALAAMACALFVAILMSIITWQNEGWERSNGDDVLPRALMAAAFVGACATIAVPAVYGMERRKSVLQSGAPRKEITAMSLTCPHCKAAQESPVGTSRCIKCGLMISLAFAEPKCEGCGYSLLDIQGELCPECGLKSPPRGVVLTLADPNAPR